MLEYLYVPIGTYVALSATFFFFPLLLHKKKRLGFCPVHVSHRGGAGENIENTLGAFEHAAKIGTDMLELDVYLTKDKQVVVFHDGWLDRLCGKPGHIRDLSYAELPPLLPTLPVSFSPGKVAVSSEAQRIPLLEEVFQRFPGIAINVDIKDKDNSEELIDKTALLIEKYHRSHLTVWGTALSHTISRKMQARLPDVAQFMCTASYFKTVLLFYTGLLPFCSIPEYCAELPLPLNLRHLSKSKSHLLVLYLLDIFCINRLLFSHLRKRGVHVVLWVLNDPAGLRRAMQCGASGVMTDYPSMLRDFLAHPSEPKPTPMD